MRRNTRQRQLVLEAVRARDDHPCADQVYLDVHKKAPHISRGTVYRNLHLLSELGVIRHVRVPGVDRYDHRVERHYHLLCTGCGAMTDVAAIPYCAAVDREVEEHTGYAIALHRTIFEGLCPICREKPPDKADKAPKHLF